MNKTKWFTKSFIPAHEAVVARQIQGEFVLIPILSGIGDLEDAIFSLNETGKAIWNKLDGKKTLAQITQELAKEYQASPSRIANDVAGLIKELLKRKMIEEVKVGPVKENKPFSRKKSVR